MPLLSNVQHARRYFYRRLKYLVLGPKAPELTAELCGRNVVVVGSAPFSARPADWNNDYRLITINASQIAAQAWLTAPPDITLMQFNQIEGTNDNALEVRRVLNGQRTGRLCMLHWRHDLQRLKDGLTAFNYGYDALQLIGRYERIALMHRVTGELNLELETHLKWSNGIVAAALALHSGAANVILTGINPKSSGHGYNALGLTRHHADMDMAALQSFAARKHPVFTADPEVAKLTGLPLWSGA